MVKPPVTSVAELTLAARRPCSDANQILACITGDLASSCITGGEIIPMTDPATIRSLDSLIVFLVQSSMYGIQFGQLGAPVNPVNLDDLIAPLIPFVSLRS